MTDYEIRITAVTVLPIHAEIFSELATAVRIVDDAAGEYIEADQCGRVDLGKIAINPEEWPQLRAAIDDMVAKCRS